MKRWKLFSFSLLSLVLSAPFSYIYLTQETELFKFNPLSEDHTYTFDFPFEELTFKPEPNVTLNAIYVPVENAKGTLIYYRGRGGNLEHPWGVTSLDFTSRGYSVLMMDYRKSGKSRGPLSYENFLSDAEYVYDYACKRFGEKNLSIYGCSLGTGVSTYIASKYNPQKLILESPYFSLFDSACNAKSWIPPLLIKTILKYPFRSDLWIQDVTCPIHVFHGIEDDVIAYNSSVRLLDIVKDKIETTHTTIEGYSHSNIYKSLSYKTQLTKILQ